MRQRNLIELRVALESELSGLRPRDREHASQGRRVVASARCRRVFPRRRVVRGGVWGRLHVREDARFQDGPADPRPRRPSLGR